MSRDNRSAEVKNTPRGQTRLKGYALHVVRIDLSAVTLQSNQMTRPRGGVQLFSRPENRIQGRFDLMYFEVVGLVVQVIVKALLS